MLAAFLAQLTEADQPMLVWYLLGGIVTISVLASNILGALVNWQQLRNANRGHECVSRTELREVHARVDMIAMTVSGEVAKMRTEVVSLIKEEREESNEHRSSIVAQLSGIQRSVGRLEGMEKTIEEHGRLLIRTPRH